MAFFSTLIVVYLSYLGAIDRSNAVSLIRSTRDLYDSVPACEQCDDSFSDKSQSLGKRQVSQMVVGLVLGVGFLWGPPANGAG